MFFTLFKKIKTKDKDIQKFSEVYQKIYVFLFKVHKTVPKPEDILKYYYARKDYYESN